MRYFILRNQFKHFFSGQSWSAATTEGLLIYSIDTGLVFDPFELEIGITPSTIKRTLAMQEYSKGIFFSLQFQKVYIRQKFQSYFLFKQL